MMIRSGGNAQRRLNLKHSRVGASTTAAATSRCIEFNHRVWLAPRACSHPHIASTLRPTAWQADCWAFAFPILSDRPPPPALMCPRRHVVAEWSADAPGTRTSNADGDRSVVHGAGVVPRPTRPVVSRGRLCPRHQSRQPFRFPAAAAAERQGGGSHGGDACAHRRWCLVASRAWSGRVRCCARRTRWGQRW